MECYNINCTMDPICHTRATHITGQRPACAQCLPDHPTISTTTTAVVHSAKTQLLPCILGACCTHPAATGNQHHLTAQASRARIRADAGLADWALVGVVLQPGHHTVLMEGVEAGQVQQLVPGLIVALTHRAGGAAATRRWQHMAAARCQQAAWQQTVTLRGLLDINDVA